MRKDKPSSDKPEHEILPRWFSLKGTGFSPYVKCSKINLGFRP
jgi:hypothetical protein